MSSIDALERLRDELTKRGESDEMMGLYLHDHEVAMQLIAAVYCEVDKRFMALPLDADGVPIHVGDVVAAQDEQPFKVRAFQLDVFGWFAIERLGSQWNVNQLHHVKLRTLEDIVIEYRLKAYNLYADSEMSGEERVEEFKTLDAEIAAEIRELLGVDA